jgi:hypothetical protein
METRIYKIDSNGFAIVKRVLEAEDMCEIKTKCKNCGTEKTEKVNANSVSDYEATDKKPAKIKCKCGDALEILSKNYIMNNFKLNGFILRDGKALGLGESHRYLYIKASAEFFSKNEKAILVNGVVKTSGSEFEKAKNEIEKEQDKAAEGFGGIFNI